MRVTLLLDAAFAAAIAAVYVYVGTFLARRPTSAPEARHALESFTTWWYALGGFTLVGAVRLFLGGIDVLGRAPHVTLLYASFVLVGLALAGLVDYLAYIWTGSTRYRRAIYLFHAGLALYLVGLAVWRFPQRVIATDWTVEPVYAEPIGGPLLALTLALVLCPALAATLGYLTLAFRVHDRMVRFRIATVSGAFIAWFGSTGLAILLRWDSWYWWPLTSQSIGLVATLAILLAYRPPRALRKRLAGDAHASVGGNL